MIKRYYPGLISEKCRVLPEYFRDDQSMHRKQNDVLTALSFCVSILLFIYSLQTISFVPFFLSLVLTGVLILPGISRSLFRSWHLRPNLKVRLAAIGLLIVFNLPLAIRFNHFRAEMARQERMELLLAKKAAKAKEIQEKQRVQNFLTALQHIESLRNDQQFSEALAELNKLGSTAQKSDEIAAINRLRLLVSFPVAKELSRKGDYSLAIKLLSSLHRVDTSNAEVLYQRAVCYEKIHQTENAVHDAKRAKLLGNSDAEKLYEKLNPLRKHVVDRVTLCNDGSYSYSTGRGTCSHHGGVATYNYPIYETSRKYE